MGVWTWIAAGWSTIACTPSATCPSLDGPAPDVPDDVADHVLAFPDEDDASAFFDPRARHEVALELTPADLATLDADPAAETYVPGAFVADGERVDGVGIRYKGSVGAFIGCVAGSTAEDPFNLSGEKTCPKLSFKISFQEYDEEGRWLGLRKLNLHAMKNDLSMMREALGYGVFRDMGVPAPRTTYVQLTVNGVLQGPFLAVEVIDGAFVDGRFADPDGALIKEVWPSQVPWRTPAVTLARLREAQETQEDEGFDLSPVVDFAHRIGDDDGDERAAALAEQLHPRALARFMAVDRTLRHDDGPLHWYCVGNNCFNHNFYLYASSASSRLWLIPWDLDAMMPTDPGTVAFTTVLDAWDDTDVTCDAKPGADEGFFGQLPPACDPVVNSLGCFFHELYDEAEAELVEGPFRRAAVDEALDAWTDLLLDDVATAHEADPRLLHPLIWLTEVDALRQRTAALRREATSR
jgi:hypothetical protein